MRGRFVRGHGVTGSYLRPGGSERQHGVWDADRAQAGLNVVGGVAFAAGSLLFLDSHLMRLGIGLFVLGSFAMAAGAIAVWRQRYARPRARAASERPPQASVATLQPPAVRAGSGAPAATETPLAASAATEVGEPQVEELYLRAS